MTRKKVLVIIALGLLLAGLGVLPVGADAPSRFTDSVTFTDTDPCMGIEQEITIYLEFMEHQGHSHNFVGHIKRTGTTDAGYVMDHGVENFVANGNVARGTFTDIWHHDNGSKFKAQGLFVYDVSAGELLVIMGGLECIGN
ncbi:MAG: hypothetical protein R3300_16010 [Candidatus Promineifilaceae bacterium]|nr:hypothetical protein [Candidatus Promineifilaceae bacterium]